MMENINKNLIILIVFLLSLIRILGGFPFTWKFKDINVKRDDKLNSKPQKIIYKFNIIWFILYIFYLPTVFIIEIINVSIKLNLESGRFSVTQLLSIEISLVLEILYGILVRLFMIPKWSKLKKVSNILISSLQQTNSKIKLEMHPTLIRMLTLAILTLCIAVFYVIDYIFLDEEKTIIKILLMGRMLLYYFNTLTQIWIVVFMYIYMIVELKNCENIKLLNLKINEDKFWTRKDSISVHDINLGLNKLFKYLEKLKIRIDLLINFLEFSLTLTILLFIAICINNLFLLLTLGPKTKLFYWSRLIISIIGLVSLCDGAEMLSKQVRDLIEFVLKHSL